MVGFPSPFGSDDGDDGGDDETFDEDDAFVPEHLPRPGEFLAGHAILTGEAHVAFHETTRAVFERRGVYDMTFGYNLARLNLDSRHENAGFRYAEDASDPTVLRAEFTPTTRFCPQASTLAVGAFRAWNGEAESHDYRLVRVRVAEPHHRQSEINEQLRSLEREYQETGTVDGDDAVSAAEPSDEAEADSPF